MNGEIRARLDRWRQHKAGAVGEACFPYILLTVVAASTFAVSGEHGARLLVDVGLCLAAAAWMLGMYTLNPAWRQRTGPMAVFVAVLLALTAVLAVRNPWFGFFIVMSVIYARTLLPWPWPVIVAVGVAAVAAESETSGQRSTPLLHLMIFLVAFAINLLFIPALVWLLRERERQIDRHQASLDELGAANRRLEATIAENETLHQQLLVQARETGIGDERRRMAREIHDTIAQGLTGIVTQLQAAEQCAERTPEDPAGWRRHVAAATRLARESLSEARRSVEALRPEPLERGRLSEALAGVAERWSALNGIAVQVTTTGAARPVHPEAELALLRAAQEALANVARHAQATRVGLTVSYMENEVALDVRDDGQGFDPAAPVPAAAGHGFGLVAMRQRVAALSGTLQVESEPGGGTAVSACVPTAAALAGS